jgi:large subunit ribosomal protein L4
MKLNVVDVKGKETGRTVELPDTVFKIEPRDHAIWLDVRALRANSRQGTHKAKSRSEVRGGGRKPFRQKGTGRARQGTIRAPHHVGGGRVFGPSPRDYSIGINKKVKKLARKSALSYKAADKNILVVENFSFDTAKTKNIVDILKALDLSNSNVLLLTADHEANIYNSAHNLHKIDVRDSVTFSTYDVLKAEKLIVQEGAITKIKEVLAR